MPTASLRACYGVADAELMRGWAAGGVRLLGCRARSGAPRNDGAEPNQRAPHRASTPPAGGLRSDHFRRRLGRPCSFTACLLSTSSGSHSEQPHLHILGALRTLFNSGAPKHVPKLVIIRQRSI